MKVRFKKSFLKDLEALDDPAIKRRVRQAIAQAEEAPTLLQVENLKKLKAGREVLSHPGRGLSSGPRLS